MNKRAHVYYSGRVQGVGFRFTVEAIAARIGVTGWVKNLPDGRVEVTAEGDEKAIFSFLNGVIEAFPGAVDDTEEEILPATGEFKDFRVRF